MKASDLKPGWICERTALPVRSSALHLEEWLGMLDADERRQLIGLVEKARKLYKEAHPNGTSV